MHELKWTQAEKKAARSLFDVALEREMTDYIARFKASAATIETPDALWALLREAEQKRRELDERYDFRYSVLVFVFAGLLRRGLIDEAELAALGEGKAHLIAELAKV